MHDTTLKPVNIRFQIDLSCRHTAACLLKTWLIDLGAFSLCLFFSAYPSLVFSEPGYVGYVGSGECRQCHSQQYADWEDSHHDLAMQPATLDTVLGDFNDAVFQHRGIQTRFYKKGEEYWLRTDNAKGEMDDFKVVYTFGVTPLQQYGKQLVNWPAATGILSAWLQCADWALRTMSFPPHGDWPPGL